MQNEAVQPSRENRHAEGECWARVTESEKEEDRVGEPALESLGGAGREKPHRPL